MPSRKPEFGEGFWPLSKPGRGVKWKCLGRAVKCQVPGAALMSLSLCSCQALCLWPAGGTVRCQLLLWPRLQRRGLQPLHHLLSACGHVSAEITRKYQIVAHLPLSGLCLLPLTNSYPSLLPSRPGFHQSQPGRAGNPPPTQFSPTHSFFPPVSFAPLCGYLGVDGFFGGKNDASLDFHQCRVWKLRKIIPKHQSGHFCGSPVFISKFISNIFDYIKISATRLMNSELVEIVWPFF